MQHLRAHAGIAGALQNAAGAAADRIGQRRIAERELVVAVGVVLVLARITACLGKLPIDAGSARPGDDRKDAVDTRCPARSRLNPRCTRSRSTRPLWEMPKPSARRMRGCPLGANGLSVAS